MNASLATASLSSLFKVPIHHPPPATPFLPPSSPSAMSASPSEDGRKAVLTLGISFAGFLCGVLLEGHRHRRQQRQRSSSSSTTLLHYPQPQSQPQPDSQLNSSSASPSSSAPSSPSSSGAPAKADAEPSGALDCPVCLCDFVAPRVLPCGHSVCTPCLLVLYEHDRRPPCPVCRRRVRPPLSRLPTNFALRSAAEERAAQRGPLALAAFTEAEDDALAARPPDSSNSGNLNQVGMGTQNNGNNQGQQQARTRVVAQLRPAWNWFKWSVIIVTEFGAFLVSLKELVDASAAPPRTRRYQRIV